MSQSQKSVDQVPAVVSTSALSQAEINRTARAIAVLTLDLQTRFPKIPLTVAKRAARSAYHTILAELAELEEASNGQ